MKTTDVSVCLDLLHNILIGPASGVESLQTKIRSVVNETAKQPKLSLPWLPVSSLLVDLLEHIADQGAKPDTLLLAGTCVVRILCRFLTLDAASDAVRQLLATPSRDSALKLCHNAFLPSPSLPSPSVNALNSPTFYHLCLIHGILSAGPDMHSLLTCQRDGTADPLITEVLRPLVGLVHDDSISRYHSVSTLHLWFKTLEQLLGKSESEEDGEAFPVGSLGKSLLTPESDATSLVLSAVDANWESSANGVSDLIRKIYQSFLNVTHSQCSIENSSAKLEVELLHIGPFHKYLLERTMQLDWKEKPKYLSLACLLQFVPFESCLKIDADFTKHCIRGLLANHLVSATVDVYRASLTFGSTRRASKEMWSLYWKVPVVDIIRCDDGTCLQNMTTHLLPWTLKNIPGSLEELADSFKTHGSDDISLSFLATLGRIGLQAGLTSRVLKEPLMAKCLVHQSNAIRIETFSLCCSSYILNAGKPEAEMSKIVQFVMANLNVDDSWFRSRLLVQFENVLLALRESIVSEFNRETRQKKRGSRKSAGQSHYTSAFCFVKEIVVLAVENLFSGANYQRAITSLSVLECVANIFRVDPSGKQRSTHKREILEKFFASETSRFELGPMQKRIRSAFLKALFHNVLEVRLSAFRLLTTHGCPLFESGSSLQDVLQDTADKYLASPRPQDNAVGALLLHLYLTNLKEEPKQLAAKLEEICSLGENSFSEFQRDPVSASASFPLHGLLLTLVTCLSDVKCILAAVQSCSANGKNRDLICGTLTRALCLARSSLFHSLFVMVPKEKQRTLGAMSANSADRVAPSFEDTNLAFTELIRGHEMAERIRFTPEQRQQVEERLASFCWHCIKNSCSLLDLVASISLKDNGISYSLDSRSLHDIVDALVAVMTGCRHRGAIESCCESLKSLCQVLSSCETTEISDIPFNFVKKALSSLTSRSKSSSVTRRSAGLPLLIRALLEGEARNVKRSMSWTVDHLSSVIRECAEQGGNSACTVDLPQAEALHVLCAVVGSASLTAAVMMHLGRILWFCFEGLASPFWLVRNAAHQLYGATAPRVLGLKKTREEFVGHDAMTALDLFAKFPDLRDFFLKKLDGSNVNNHDLYFVLDFLSRLKPPAIGQQGIKSLVPFQQCIRNHLGCRSWKLRLLAAKCVSSFCRRTKKEVMLLLGNVATLKGARSHNSAHAHLYAVNRLLTNNTVCVPDIAKWFQESGSLSRLSWTLSSNFFVRMEFLDLLDLLSVNGDNTESQEKLQKSFLLDIADTARLEKLPGSVAWRQKQTQWFLRRAACLCPAEIVAVVQKGKECDVVMETALEFLNPQALRPDCGITPDLWCEVAVALVRFLNGTSGLPDQSADVLDLLGVLLNKREVANKCVNPALLATFQCISVEKSSVAGTTVRALSLVVWSHCLKHCLQNPDCYSPEVERSAESWTSAITSAVSNREKLAATADVRRMHAARSLRVAGDSVFAWAAWKCKPRKSKLLQSLFSATLALLQDEDPQVRSEAAGALPLRSDGPQSLPVQPNIAADNLFKKLVLAFEGDTAQLVKFLWRELCRSGPSALCEFQQLTKPTVASLFEQDESGVFMEPMVVSHMLHRGTQMALEGALQGSTDLMSFLLDEALRLADELMAASQAIGEFTLLTDKPLGTNLEILARPKLHHGIAVLRARADLVEWACAHFIAEPRPGATAETLRPGKEVGELSLLPNAAFQLSHVKACFVELWTRLTFE